MSEEIIKQAELEYPRSAAEFLPWVRSALDRFNTKPLRQEARAGKHFAAELTEEMFPIGLFAHRHFSDSPQVIVRYVLGNQAHDAIVDDQRSPPGRVRYIEVTLADHDYEDAKRMELLNRDGHAPSYGSITAKGPRHRRTKLHAQLEAVDHEELRAQHLDRVVAAVAKKSHKSYPLKTALVVRVDDSGPFRHSEDAVVLGDLVAQCVLPLVSGREFSVLAIVGGQGLYLEWPM